ncbi:rust resistance kinase Lr10-like protein, partial [Tanacetum coccineum]
MGMECLHGSDSPATHSTLPPPLLRHIPFPTYPSLFEKQKLLAKLPMGWYPMRQNNQFLGYFTPISVIHWIVICLVEDLVQSQLIRTFCLASTFYEDCAPGNCGDGMNLPNKNLTRYRIGSCDQLVMNEYDMNLGIAMEVCSQTVVAPVELEEDYSFEESDNMVNGGNYTEVMKLGFKSYWYGLDCSNSLIVGVVMISVVVFLCFKKKLRQRRRTKNSVNIANFLKNHEFLDPKKYSYSQVKKMTNSFKVKLGQGGFGSVYKGELSNGNLVAVKILSELKGNGEDFINEVASVGRTCHVNIVNLVG